MENDKSSGWWLYIISCSDGSFYTGITTDVVRRLKEHQAGGRKASRYLRGRGPLQVQFSSKVGNKSEAAKAEALIKKLSKSEKIELVEGRVPLDKLLK
jgi:putative endonuclease